MRKTTLVGALVGVAIAMSASAAEAKAIKECKKAGYHLSHCGSLVQPLVPHTGSPYTS